MQDDDRSRADGSCRDKRGEGRKAGDVTRKEGQDENASGGGESAGRVRGRVAPGLGHRTVVGSRVTFAVPLGDAGD